jgi:hypothetical protein
MCCARVQQKIEGANAINRCLNNNQVSVAQLKFDGLARWLFLRRKDCGQQQRKEERPDRPASPRTTTSLWAADSNRHETGRLQDDLPIGAAPESLSAT